MTIKCGLPKDMQKRHIHGYYLCFEIEDWYEIMSDQRFDALVMYEVVYA